MNVLRIGSATVKRTKRRYRIKASLINSETHERTGACGKGRTHERALAAALGLNRIFINNRDGDLVVLRAAATGKEFAFLASGRDVEVF